MRRARWIAVRCPAWALTGPFTSSRAGPLAELNSEKTDLLVQPTNDLAWLLTFEMNVGPIEVLQIQKLLNPRDPEINLDASEPDFEQAEQICLVWLEPTKSVYAKVLLATIRFERGTRPQPSLALTEVIAQDPLNWKALWIRSQVLHAGGRVDAARADAQRMIDALPNEEIDELFDQDGDGPGPFSFALLNMGFDIHGDPDVLAALVAIHFVGYFVLGVRCGCRQRREAGGTWRGLIIVAMAIAALWTMPVLTATILIDQGNPQRTLALIRSVERDLHKLDPMHPLVAARALRELGRNEEAQAECNLAAKLAPDDVSVKGFSASLALQRGDRAEADRVLDLANSLLPAELLVIVARAERAILDDDMETLRKEHDALAASLADDRLLNLHSVVARLKAALPSVESADVDDDSAEEGSPNSPSD